MAGLIMSVVAVIHLAWSLYLNKKVVEDFTPIEKEWRHLNRRRVERWEKMERVKTCGKETEELHEMRTWMRRIIGLDLGFWLWYCLVTNVRQVIAMIGLVVIMAYGAHLVWSGQWMIGMLYPLFMWAAVVADNMWQLGRIEQQFNWNVPSVSAMKEALTLKPDIVCTPDAPVICHQSPVRVAFDNVSYTYPRGSKEEGTADQKSVMNVIRGVTFEIAAGEKVALIGPSGAGKTTIMRLLLRYVDPDQGCIHVNGYKLNELNLFSWMKAVGYIPQQPQVLDGTIRYNLTYGLPNEQREKVTDDQLWELMRLLQIDFGERLDKGLETVVGRNGVKLSGGQAQRLMIGAAAMKRPLFMVIDEATSSLDSSTEKLVQRGLARVLSGNVSALVIAHRLSTVRHLCDRFIILRDTAVLQNGDSQVEAIAASFEELYTISPTFRCLADDQGIVI
jgi:ABC-type multidrug transport system fused ATPase/permease subunit